MAKERDLSFDFIKGVLIFLVVCGHCLNEIHAQHTHGVIDFWIYTFHMPIFMFVSGWFAWHSLDKGFFSTLRSKLHRLALPALIWSSIIFVQRIVMGETASFRCFYESCRGMWFLWCLFGLFCISALIWKLRYRDVIATCLAVTLLALYPYYPNDLLKHFKVALYFPVFFLGANLSHIAPPPFNKKPLWQRVAIMAISIVTYIASCYQATHCPPEYRHIAVMGINLSCILPYMVILRALYGIVSKTKMATIFCTLGGSTLGIYALNERFILPLSHLAIFPLNSVTVTIAIAVPITALCWAATVLIRKNGVLRNYTLGEK